MPHFLRTHYFSIHSYHSPLCASKLRMISDMLIRKDTNPIINYTLPLIIFFAAVPGELTEQHCMQLARQTTYRAVLNTCLHGRPCSSRYCIWLPLRCLSRYLRDKRFLVSVCDIQRWCLGACVDITGAIIELTSITIVRLAKQASTTTSPMRPSECRRYDSSLAEDSRGCFVLHDNVARHMGDDCYKHLEENGGR